MTSAPRGRPGLGGVTNPSHLAWGGNGGREDPFAALHPRYTPCFRAYIRRAGGGRWGKRRAPE